MQQSNMQWQVYNSIKKIEKQKKPENRIVEIRRSKRLDVGP